MRRTGRHVARGSARSLAARRLVVGNGHGGQCSCGRRAVAAGGVPVTVIGSATKVQDDLAADVTAFEQLERLVDLVQWQYAVDGYL